MAETQPQTLRSYYKEDIDFKALAAQDEDFAALLASNDGRIDWQDPLALQQLTRSLLARDFNLTLTLPPDRLCPPVPVRWNYIRWLHDLLATTDPSTTTTLKPPQRPAPPLKGLDIGTGASAIYALLACASHPRTTMHATDIDPHSLHHAQHNIAANSLSARITLHASPAHLIPEETLPLSFTVCNPPFYASAADHARATASKTHPPSAICSGAPNEMLCAGGDAGFALRILAESLRLRGRVAWYSCMLGRLASLRSVVGALRAEGVGNYAVANLAGGRKTVRWAVAWSFGDARPEGWVGRFGGVVGGLGPVGVEWTVEVPGGLGRAGVGERVDGVVGGLRVRWEWDGERGEGLMVAGGNVWSRAARRKRKFGEMREGVDGEGGAKEGGVGVEDGGEEKVALAVKIVCSEGRVDLRWLRGTDFTLWESFCGMLKRALGAREKGAREKGGKEKMEEGR